MDFFQRDFRDVAIAVAFVFVAYKFFKKFNKVSTKAFYKGKVVVITGASSGIGEELALILADYGANLVLAARRIERLDALVKKCKEKGVDALAVQTDVSKEEDCKNLISSAIKKFGVIDVLLLNAGTGCLMKLSEVTDMKPYRETLDINFWGYVYPTHQALDHLRKSKGTIIAISSLAAIIPTPRRCAYGASKAALNAFFDCLRQEESNIQISIVCPGFVLTEIHDRAFTPGNKKVEREKGNFMTSKEASQIILNAASNKKNMTIMTAKAKFGYYMRPFLPNIIDRMAKNHAEKSVKAE